MFYLLLIYSLLKFILIQWKNELSYRNNYKYFVKTLSKKEKKVNNKEKMRIETDPEFQQNEINILNKKYNIKIFSGNISGRKAFAAEQKIREFK